MVSFFLGFVLGMAIGGALMDLLHDYLLILGGIVVWMVKSFVQCP